MRFLNSLKYLLTCLIIYIFIFSPLKVLGDTLETAGNILHMAIPLYAFVYSCTRKDYQGIENFSESYSATLITTYFLKKLVREKRPNGKDYNSFPSWHTASAFSGATYLYRRYNSTTFEKLQGGIALILAGITGYSRIYSKTHYTRDVIAGAAIAAGFTYLFIKPLNPRPSFEIGPDFLFIGLTINY